MIKENTLSLDMSMRFKLDASVCDPKDVRKIAEQMRVIKHAAQYIEDLIERVTPEESGDLVDLRWSSSVPHEVADHLARRAED